MPTKERVKRQRRRENDQKPKLENWCSDCSGNGIWSSTRKRRHRRGRPPIWEFIGIHQKGCPNKKYQPNISQLSSYRPVLTFLNAFVIYPFLVSSFKRKFREHYNSRDF